MGKVHDTESFIKKAVIVHNSTYDYDKTIWTSNKEKLIITCKVHGEFMQSANNHLSGYGCNECAKISTKAKQAHTTEQFINKSRTIHGDTYDYSKCVYKNTKTPVVIICKEHGPFLQSPGNHTHKTKPQACPTCSYSSAANNKKLQQSHVLSCFTKTHGNKYDYSGVVYTNYHEKTAITCPTHGVFYQTPAHHISGTGCPSCADYGFDPTKPAVLYYLSVNNGMAYKIGITNREVRLRFSTKDFHKIEVLKEWEFQLGKDAYEYEKTILRKFRHLKYTGPLLLQNGNTELFYTDILSEISQIMEALNGNSGNL